MEVTILLVQLNSLKLAEVKSLPIERVMSPLHLQEDDGIILQRRTLRLDLIQNRTIVVRLI